MNRKDWTVEKVFHRLLTNKSEKTHWDNVRELRSRGSQEVFDKCEKLLHSENEKERLIAAEILSQLGLPPRPFIKETLKLFFEILEKETSSQVISTILFGIGHNNEHLTEKETEFICSFKENKNSDIKHGLVFALGGIKHMVAIDTLIECTKDKNNTVRDWATFGLGSQADHDNMKIRTALWDRISDRHMNTKQEAILGLARRKDERVNEIIKRELQEIDNYNCLLFESIEALDDKEFIDILEEKLNLHRDEKEVNLQWIKYTIEKLKEKEKTNA